MFSLEDVEPETFSGEIGQLMKTILAISSNTSQKRLLIDQLKNICSSKGYVLFRGFSHNFHISRVGQSCIYDVPDDKRGHLSVFRGERVRLICVGSGTRFVRWYMSGLYTE